MVENIYLPEEVMSQENKKSNTSPGIILSDFVVVKPAPPIPQEISCELLAMTIAKVKSDEGKITDKKDLDNILKRAKIKVSQYGISSKYIKQRYMAIAANEYLESFNLGNDFADNITKKILDNNKFTIPALKSKVFRDFVVEHRNPQGMGLDKRMALYEKIALKSVRMLYKNVESPPDDVIHVTTSGYLKPNPIERFFSERQWLDTAITHSYHMGCYASIPAVRMAHGFLCSSLAGITPVKTGIDIVHTEILTAHSRVVEDSIEQIFSMTLFGDGFIKYTAYSEEHFKKTIKKNGLKVIAVKQRLLKDSLADMTWNLGPHNFKINFGLSVPYLIRDHIKLFVNELFFENGFDFEKEKCQGNLVYAIHPSGPVVIIKICETLGLTDEDIALTNKIFYENGNMSSATVPHMLEEIIRDEKIKPGKKVLVFAYGPGLTIAGMILEKV
jgi:predicted naringenin-chalcone synthase/chorismate mutase